MSEFFAKDPSLENYWRSIILFGKNVASYKFALAKALIDLKFSPNDLVSLTDLAEPFSRHICDHLKHSPKQATSSKSQFLDVCNNFNNHKISKDELIAQTKSNGFKYVIDAFHIVNGSEIEKRFFVDERKQNSGIRITDEFYNLTETSQFDSLPLEVEARWRLVEESWRLGISRNLLEVQYDGLEQFYLVGQDKRRVSLASVRDSLNGYQKGLCFYCYDLISIKKNEKDLAEVDHFIPHMLNEFVQNIDGVWNLVLSCQNCNRGPEGKFAKIPTLEHLYRLHKRNEYFIDSHLPLREALIRQTGKTEPARRNYLQQVYNEALTLALHTWKPQPKGAANF